MSAPWEEYAASKSAAPAVAPWEEYSGQASDSPSVGKQVLQGGKNLVAGLLRGAGSIGATIAWPLDKMGVTGMTNDERRARLDENARELIGADTDSLLYKGGKLGGEIAGTAGMGGVLAKPLQALAATRYGTGIEPILNAGAQALQTGGFRVGELAGTGASIPMRIAAGTAVGGASAGLVKPEDAAMGAAIGGTLPAATLLAGKAGQMLGRSNVKATPQMMEAAREAAAKGYVIPPADLNPGGMTEALSGLSGKIKTAQVASQRNQGVTDRLAREAIGLNAGDDLTADVLQAVRNQAGQKYEALRNIGEISPDRTYFANLQRLASENQGASRSFPGLKNNGLSELVETMSQPKFDAGDAIDATRTLRELADKSYRAGDKALGKAQKQIANELEDVIERQLSASGNKDAVKEFQEARKLIAKTYTVQKALNDKTGSVAAPVIAKELSKGRPLSGELLDIASVAQAFPKATQALKETPKALSPLDWAVAAMGAGGAASTGNVLPLAMIAARPAARSLLLSSPMQRAALAEAAPELGLLGTGAYRTLPLLSAQ